MQPVEQHIIHKGDARYEAIDQAAFASKNLYNLANYHMRQSFIHTGKYMEYAEVYHLVKQNVKQVRLVPRHGHYVVEVVYEQEGKQAQVNPDLIAGIDIGLNNLAMLTSNKPGFTPLLVNGRPLKSINQYYNKRKADLQAKLGTTGTTNRMERLTNKRTRKINHYLHTHSHRIIEHLVEEGIGTLVIGKNANWKQEAHMGKRTNQQFVQIPHARFIDMLTYKAELVGIRAILQEESHTSKCSFLDNEPICHQEQYMGKRVKRGLFRSALGRRINADVNGSYNIIRKAIPHSFSGRQGIEGVAVRPVGTPTY